MSLSIVKACHDEQLFRPFLQDRKGKVDTWRNWMVALKCLYGLPVTLGWQRDLVRDCTGRDASLLPSDGFTTALFLTGRRSGKSRIAAVVGAYEASLSGKEKLLAKGEMGMVAIVSPTKLQSQIVKSYLRAVYDTPLLAQEVVQEDKEGFQLRNNIRIQILTGDFRAVRGFTLLAAVVDEAAFFGHTEESRVKSDSELVRSIKPALATCGGRLIAITSPYARKGWTWTTHKRYHGNDSGSILVWNCPSRTMNPTLPQSVVDEAMAEDLAAAKSEFGGEFRDDVALWLPREAIEPCIVAGRKELLAKPGIRYVAFVDVSGGRSDDAALGIAHRDDERKKSILDCERRWKAPFTPAVVVADMVDVLTSYGIRHVTGDSYGAEWVAQSFGRHGIRYAKADKNKSQLYLELLPRICSGEVELLDDEVLIAQLGGLERRTRSGGRDIVDHQPGAKDDVANAAAGALVVAASRGNFRPGFLTRHGDRNGGRGDVLRNRMFWARMAQTHRARF